MSFFKPGLIDFFLPLGVSTINCKQNIDLLSPSIVDLPIDLYSRHKATLAFVWSCVSGHTREKNISKPTECFILFTSRSPTLSVCCSVLYK